MARELTVTEDASVPDGQLAPLLAIRDVSIVVRGAAGTDLSVVESARLSIRSGGSMGLVGESGSGKTMLCRALIGTLGRHDARVVGGSIEFAGVDWALASKRVFARMRGSDIGYVPQSSLAGLNPVLTVYDHLSEVIRLGGVRDRRAVKERAIELLDQVRIPRARAVLTSRAHELSGGMRQRVLIACAIARTPRLLVADEPTTALDVTVQRDVLRLLAELRRDHSMTLLLISHDPGVIEEVCDEMTVMYSGATVESGPVEDLRRQPAHPYSAALRDSRVDMATPDDRLRTVPGEPVAVGRWFAGCRFAPRCSYAGDECTEGESPASRWLSDDRAVACHRPLWSPQARTQR